MSQYKLQERLQVPVVKIFYSCTREEKIAENAAPHTGTQSSLWHFPAPEFSRVWHFFSTRPCCLSLLVWLMLCSLELPQELFKFLSHTLAQPLLTLPTFQISSSPIDEQKPRCLLSVDFIVSLSSTCSTLAILSSCGVLRIPQFREFQAVWLYMWGNYSLSFYIYLVTHFESFIFYLERP